MSRQDRQGVRSPTDIERKYDLGSLVGMKKAVENSEEGLNKTNKTLEDFVALTLGNFENIQNQIDGNVTTYFYSGAPSLETEPASEWTTDEGKNDHIADLYYDQDTGQAYRFTYDDDTGYYWQELGDNGIAEALAIANSAQDTADGKRRVFTVQPDPPYDCGDLWFCDMEIYICQTSKAEGEEYEEDDFTTATNYTDNTLATQVGDELEIVRGTVALLQASVSSLKLDFETSVKSINQLNEEVTESLEKTSYEFSTEDFTVSKSGSEMETHISDDGMRVKKNGQDVLVASNLGVDATNLHAKTYLIIGANSRFEDYEENRTGCFWIGG